MARLWNETGKIDQTDAAAYEKLVDIHEKILWEYYRHPESFREENRYIESGALYNLACYKALAGKNNRHWYPSGRPWTGATPITVIS